jgi:hypothetical protein
MTLDDLSIGPHGELRPHMPGCCWSPPPHASAHHGAPLSSSSPQASCAPTCPAGRARPRAPRWAPISAARDVTKPPHRASRRARDLASRQWRNRASRPWRSRRPPRSPPPRAPSTARPARRSTPPRSPRPRAPPGRRRGRVPFRACRSASPPYPRRSSGRPIGRPMPRHKRAKAPCRAEAPCRAGACPAVGWPVVPAVGGAPCRAAAPCRAGWPVAPAVGGATTPPHYLLR